MDEIGLVDYMRVLSQRKWTAIVVVLVVLLTTGVGLAIVPRVYEGKTSILFPQRATGGVSARLAQLAGFALPGGLQTFSSDSVYMTVLKSRTISSNVCKTLALDRYDVEHKDLQDNLILRPAREGGLILTCRVPTSWLRGHVPRKQLRDRTAELAARIANTYVDELAKYDRANVLFMGRKERIFIERQLGRTKEELAEAEADLQKFQEKHPTLIPPEKSSEYASQALRIADQQTETEVALREVEGQLEKARATWSSGAPEDISPEAVIDSPAIRQLRQSVAALEVTRATLLEDFHEAHPDVVSVTQEIEKTYEQIRSEVEAIVAGRAGSASPAHQELLKQLVLLEVNRDGVEARKSALEGAMSGLERGLSGLPKEEIEYGRLLRQVKAAETVYTTLLVEHAKARVEEGRETDNFIVLDEAVAPRKPARPRVQLTLAAALVFGVMLGVIVATFRGPSARRRPE